MIKIKNLDIFNIGMYIIRWMSNVAKLPVNNFEWIKNTSQFSEDFIKIL